MRVLVIEDDERLARVITRLLQSEKFDVAVAHDGNAGLELALSGSFDLAIVDRMLPGLNGIEIVRQLRDEPLPTPILMLTALSDLPERVEGLDAGADDYLGKPFAFEELLARIRALTRRIERPIADVKIEIGSLVVNLSTHEVFVDEARVELTAQEFRVLEVLARNRGRVMSRDELLERAWGPDADPAGNVVDLYIFYLRKKLGNLPGGSSPIQTVRGAGYVLRAGR